MHVSHGKLCWISMQVLAIVVTFCVLSYWIRVPPTHLNTCHSGPKPVCIYIEKFCSPNNKRLVEFEGSQTRPLECTVVSKSLSYRFSIYHWCWTSSASFVFVVCASFYVSLQSLHTPGHISSDLLTATLCSCARIPNVSSPRQTYTNYVRAAYNHFVARPALWTNVLGYYRWDQKNSPMFECALGGNDIHKYQNEAIHYQAEQSCRTRQFTLKRSDVKRTMKIKH